MEKTAIRFDSELKAQIQNMMSEANATSMADFVRQATEFYIAYLRQKKSIDFLAPLLAQTIKNEIESVEKNISSMLYRQLLVIGINQKIAIQWDFPITYEMARAYQKANGKYLRQNQWEDITLVMSLELGK